MGRVHVRVNPWAEVFYGGRRLGITPMGAIQLPAGRRTQAEHVIVDLDDVAVAPAAIIEIGLASSSMNMF
jgi:hypothetical protein